MSTIDRTLVKSPPEVWLLISDPERAGAWMAALGATGEIGSEATGEEAIVWRPNDGGAARLELFICEKGWGTNVSIAADAAEGAPAQPDEVLEQLLEELASPERRPFAGVI